MAQCRRIANGNEPIELVIFGGRDAGSAYFLTAEYPVKCRAAVVIIEIA